MIKLELSLEMVDVIGRALNQMPYGVAAPVVDEMQKQINGQQRGVPTVDEMVKEVKAAA